MLRGDLRRSGLDHFRAVTVTTQVTGTGARISTFCALEKWGKGGAGGINYAPRDERLSYAPQGYSPLVTIEQNRSDEAEKRAKLGGENV
jgi:hypothetical protein